MNAPQKFTRGDVVHIAADLGSSMFHFEKDKDVVILGSYADKFGGTNTHSYTVLFIEDGNEISWYEEYQLTFLRHEDEGFIEKIKKAREEYDAKVSQLDWIVDHWKDVRSSLPQSSAVKLMALIGITEPWGKHGEYWDFYEHYSLTFKLLDPVLLTGDIKKVEEFIQNIEKADGFLLSNDLHNGNSIKRDLPASWKQPHK